MKARSPRPADLTKTGPVKRGARGLHADLTKTVLLPLTTPAPAPAPALRGLRGLRS